MKTSILNSITETHLLLLFHYLIIFLLILGFYACSKTGAKGNPSLPPDQKSTNIKETGSGASVSIWFRMQQTGIVGPRYLRQKNRSHLNKSNSKMTTMKKTI